MDLRKLKTLIDLVSESNVSELEITEADGKVRIVKAGAAPVVMLQAAPRAAERAERHTGQQHRRNRGAGGRRCQAVHQQHREEAAVRAKHRAGKQHREGLQGHGHRADREGQH